MSPTDNIATAKIEEADRIASLIATARRLLDDQKMVDLSALEVRVAELCQDIEGLPESQSGPLRTALKTIIADLDRLAADLTRQNQTVRRLGTGEDPKRAAQAYTKEH